MYRSLLAYANPFEEEYGINNTWSPMRRVIINLIQGIRDSIRELSIEVPIARYDLTHTIYNNLVEFNSKGFRKVKWTEMPVTITNKRLIFGQKGKPFDVPLNSIATVGREIYMVYTGSINKGILKAIDFKLRETGMSCAVAVAKEDIMEDFIRTVKVMRNEWRKLSPIEARILTAIYHDANPGDLAKVAKCEKEMAELGYQRLLELRYIDETGRITSFGINTAEQYIKS